MSQFFTTEKGDIPEVHPGFRLLTVKSNALGRRADITVFNPVEKAGSKSLPVVLLLHGVYGSHWAWALSGKAHLILLDMMQKKQVEPMVLVMPSDGLYGDGSAYVPHNDANYESWIVRDVLDAVRENVEGVSKASPVFITGLSMGGYGALRLGAKYPSVFKAFSGMSSITGFEQMKIFVQDYSSLYASATEHYDVIDLMLKNRERLSPFRFDCGSEDVLIAHNRQLHHELLSNKIPHEYQEHTGGHSWQYWQDHLPENLLFFQSVLTGTAG
ncbi:MAG: esterase family protein [Bacteroidetes bacterium]|nr:esterase family protein [Bacteroidota bacterium]